MFLWSPMLEHRHDYVGPRREKRSGWNPSGDGRINEFSADSSWVYILWAYPIVVGAMILAPLWTAADVYGYDSGRWRSVFRATTEYVPILGFMQFTFLRFDSLEAPVRVRATAR